jgi:SAM-dependent methyltransferase
MPEPTPHRNPSSEVAVPLSVWPTAQTSHRAQRTGRYLPGSAAHPARMLPALARNAIERYSKAGELVIDPLCGIGTTLVEAVHLGRDALGVELEPRWAELAERNLAYAMGHGAGGIGSVSVGDARQLPRLLAGQLDQPAALVLTSPPYASWAHGHVRAGRGGKVAKWNHRYTPTTSRANLATAGEAALLAGMVEILAACAKVLRPSGLVVLTARPWRRGGLLVDFPGALERAAEQAGLVLVERAVALLAGLRGDRLVPRASFFALDNARKARARGMPIHVIAHEDVLVLQTTRPS